MPQFIAILATLWLVALILFTLILAGFGRHQIALSENADVRHVSFPSETGDTRGSARVFSPEAAQIPGTFEMNQRGKREQ